MANTPGKAAAATEPPAPAGEPDARPEGGAGARTFTLWERAQLAFVSWVGYWVIWVIGRTLRWEVRGWENWEAARKLGRGLILTCWHREIFPGSWFWRKRGIVVMASRNFDGEYIARILRRHGYGAARGSSTRGGPRALAEIARALEAGQDAALTIDGPRGPRFVAKTGSVLLSKATGAAILCFHIALSRAYVFKKSWDLFQVPFPFSRAAVFLAPTIAASPQATDVEQAGFVQQVQSALDELSRCGEEWKARP